MLLPVGSKVVATWNPAVAFAQKTDEEGRKVAAAVNLFEADVDGDAVFGFFFRYAPAQVDLGEAYLPRQTRCPNLGENVLDEVIPLRFHVAEGAGEENADFSAFRSGGGLIRGHDFRDPFRA